MVYVIGDNITSPLGCTTEENLQAVLRGESALHHHPPFGGLRQGFTASLFSQEQWSRMMQPDLTRFEALAAASVKQALSDARIAPSSERIVFVLSTTKANVELLSEPGSQADSRLRPAVAARRIAKACGIATPPIVVCNACISGLSAIITASRLLESGEADVAIVCGADCQGKFIISGFQSLGALDEAPCRPFDQTRAGLNLGEAAATIVLSAKPSATDAKLWAVVNGCVRNDANHISGPSRTAEGSYRALTDTLKGENPETLATVSVHGTATPYNDEMETIALERTGLSAVPLTALKGYYGHTMGAAGVLESIVTMHAADRGLVVGARGFGQTGVSRDINIAPTHRATSKQAFVKLLSGFGGCNAAVLFRKHRPAPLRPRPLPQLRALHVVELTPRALRMDQSTHQPPPEAGDWLTHLYKTRIGSYPKYYKMDPLARLAFVATELLLQLAATDGAPRPAVVLFNSASSIHADRRHQAALRQPLSSPPSPAVFVYTLPSITTGEIAIRHHLHGETAFCLLPREDKARIEQIVRTALLDPAAESIIGGWVEYFSATRFRARLTLYQREAGRNQR